MLIKKHVYPDDFKEIFTFADQLSSYQKQSATIYKLKFFYYKLNLLQSVDIK